MSRHTHSFDDLRCGWESDYAARECETILRRQCYHDFVHFAVAEQRAWVERERETPGRGNMAIPGAVADFLSRNKKWSARAVVGQARCR